MIPGHASAFEKKGEWRMGKITLVPNDCKRSRAVAAYLARRCFGYRSKDVAAALGYSSAGGVGQAICRVEAARSRIGRTVQELARRPTNG
jgi:hypothetical protein